jgi:hypothetical protein
VAKITPITEAFPTFSGGDEREFRGDVYGKGTCFRDFGVGRNLVNERYRDFSTVPTPSTDSGDLDERRKPRPNND